MAVGGKDVTMSNVVALPIVQREKPISVIIVSYMTGPALLESVSSVLDDPDIFELIIVDNGNTYDARKRLSDLVANHDHIRLLQGHGNIGFARACNYGARLARGEFLLFLNPDAVLTEGAARVMARCGQALTRPWITGGMLRDIHGMEQRGGRRGQLTPLSALVSFTPLHKLPFFKSVHRESEPLPGEPAPIATVSGAFMMMDRASFDLIDGFDESYFLHVEDIDICRRTRQAGGDVYFVPGATVMHYGSTSQVRRQTIEYQKLKGFIRYFWNYSSHWWGKALTILAAPFMAVAIMSRAWWLAIRMAVLGR